MGINSKQQKKTVYWNPLNSLTYDDLWDFITSMDRGEAELHDLEYLDSKPTKKEQDTDTEL